MQSLIGLMQAVLQGAKEVVSVLVHAESTQVPGDALSAEGALTLIMGTGEGAAEVVDCV